MKCVFDALQTAPYHNILATPHYEEWKYFRKMTNPAFSPENIRKVNMPFSCLKLWRTAQEMLLVCPNYIQVSLTIALSLH